MIGVYPPSLRYAVPCTMQDFRDGNVFNSMGMLTIHTFFAY
jgi:hypothetical protein